jgi:iron(III) transport system permease protein
MSRPGLARTGPSLALGLILTWLVLVPLGLLGVASLRPTGFPLDDGWTLANYAAVYGAPDFWRMVRATAVFALGAVATALTLGIAIAWLVERTDMPGAAAARALVILPMATPPLLLAIGWAMLLSPRAGVLNTWAMDAFGLASAPFDIYSLGGMVFVEGLSLVPTTVLILSPAFRNVDPALEEAALASGSSGWRVVTRVLLPLLWPAILAAAAFLLIVGCLVFDIPGTLGMPARIFVLSTRMYEMAAESPTGVPLYGQVSALATLSLVLLLTLGFGYHRLTRASSRYRTISGKGFRPRRMALGRWRWAGAGFVGLYFLLAVGLPVGMLGWMSLMPYQQMPSRAALALLTLDNHRELLESLRTLEAAGNSLIAAVLSATGVAVLSTLVGWAVLRARLPGARVLDTLAFIPIAIPGVMLGVALLFVYITLDPILPIYGTVWILAVAYVTHYLSFGTRLAGGTMVQIHPELEEAGRTSGAGPGRVLRRITLPLFWPAAVAIWIWVFAHALRELSTALLLASRDNRTVPVLLWEAWSGGEPTRAAAVGVWLVAALLVVLIGWEIAAARTLSRRSRMA